MEIAEIAFSCFFLILSCFFGWFLGSLYIYALHVCFSSQWTSPEGQCPSQCPYVCFCCLCVVRPVIAFCFCWALSSALRSHDQIPGLIKFSPKMNYWKFCRCTTPLKKNKITFKKKRKEIIPPPKKKIILRLEVFSVSRMRDFNFFNNHFLCLALYFENEQEWTRMTRWNTQTYKTWHQYLPRFVIYIYLGKTAKDVEF